MDRYEQGPSGDATADVVKVVFDVPQDEDGWPPVTREGLWAVPKTSDVVRLHNTPWFVRGVANGDLVRVRRDDDGGWRAVERLQWSGYRTIRVVPFRSGSLEGSLQRVLDAFAPLRVTGEGLAQYGIVALDVPPDADLVAVQRLLRRGQHDGWWGYEEGCVDDTWLAVDPDRDSDR